jgi:ATP-dependent Lon protease
MFIATANSLDTISPPLLDRCEIIECSGYVTDEKLAIAKKFLLPRQIKECGLEEGKVVMHDDALLRVILDYTGEVCFPLPAWLMVGWCSIA